MLAPAEPSKRGGRGGGRQRRHEAKKEEGGERERETRTEREPPLGYLSRAARFADRIRSSPLALSSCRCLTPPTDRSSHPFPSPGTRRSGRPRAPLRRGTRRDSLRASQCPSSSGVPSYHLPQPSSRVASFLSTFFFHFVLLAASPFLFLSLSPSPCRSFFFPV